RALAGLNVPFPVDFYQELGSNYNGDAFQKVIFSDSHDTAANGQVRLNEAVTPGNAESQLARQRTLLASAMTLTAPGIPMLMQGQEFMQEGDFSDWKELEWAKTEQFAGIVEAHKHLTALRRNTYGNTAGLQGQGINVFHRDDTNTVLAYHRWHNGGPRDDTLVIANFGTGNFDNYELIVPVSGTWQVRFNSTWGGYGTDMKEIELKTIITDDSGRITIPMAASSVVVLSQD
ncbi:MAG TPA: alpha amylase C-terminal domain-containing protein, partial [Candidatus Saccharibacteria bacterium]|nr:alpha amylase C-terminal domain-containing protein [Candidatus Saccharibacteria bacterium]